MRRGYNPDKLHRLESVAFTVIISITLVTLILVVSMLTTTGSLNNTTTTTHPNYPGPLTTVIENSDH